MANTPVNSSSAMTVVTVTTNGQVAFDYDFRADNISDMRAELLRLDETKEFLTGGVDFTASGLGTANGGTITVTTVSDAAIGETLTIYRDTVIQRLNDFSRDLFADEVNAEFDKIYMILQEQGRDIGRTVSLADYLKNDGSQIAIIKGFNVSPNGADTLFARDKVNLADGVSLQSKSADFSQDKSLEIIAKQTQLLSTQGPVLIKGSAGTDLSPQSLHVFTQPQATGTAEGSYLMNRFEAEFHREQLGDGSIEGDEGSGIVNLLHCYIGVGGPNFKADSVAAAAFGTVINQADTSIGDRLGFNSGVLAMFSTTARLYGGSTGVTIAEGASAAQMIGFEADMFLFGATDYKFGFHSWAGGKHQATIVDAAYGVGIRGGTIDGDPVAKWKSVIHLFTGTSGNRPVDENSEFLTADAATSLKNLFNLSNITIIEDIIKSAAVTLTGDGQLTLGNNTEIGSLALNAPVGAPCFFSVQHEGDPKWNWGINGEGAFFISNLDLNQSVMTVSLADNAVILNKVAIDDNAWAAYTPVVTSESGAITTMGARVGKYRRLAGRTIVAQVRATVTTAGTAGGALIFTLPVAAATDIPAVVNGRESALNGRGLCGLTNGASAIVTYDDASSVFANGVQVTVEVTYEAAVGL